MAFKLDLTEWEGFQKIMRRKRKKKGCIRYNLLLYFEREKEQNSDRSLAI